MDLVFQDIESLLWVDFVNIIDEHLSPKSGERAIFLGLFG